MNLLSRYFSQHTNFDLYIQRLGYDSLNDNGAVLTYQIKEFNDFVVLCYKAWQVDQQCQS